MPTHDGPRYDWLPDADLDGSAFSF